MKFESAFNLVVYCAPGPANPRIEEDSREIVRTHSPINPKGPLGYLVLHPPDFQRLWSAVNGGEGLGAAYEVLPYLGPRAAQFVGRVDEFLFGWIGARDTPHGRVLLLQVFPRPHTLRARGKRLDAADDAG